MITFGDYDLKNDCIYWLPDSRAPNLVIFNHYWQMQELLNNAIQDDSKVQLQYCDIGFENMPFRTFLTFIEGKTPLLSLNVLISSQIQKIKDVIKSNATVSVNTFTQNLKRESNSHFILWSGWDYRIDWVEEFSKNNITS